MTSTSTRTSDQGRILIIGGYGQVGESIALRLSARFPGGVIVAGRDLARAERCAATLGHGTGARAIDLTHDSWDDALDGVALVVVCADQSDTRFVRACIAHGIDYVDITASDRFFSRLEALEPLAVRGATTVMLSVGVAPGLSNLLAARACASIESVDRVDLLIELGLGDHHGAAAIAWTLETLGAEFEVFEDGRARRVRGFGELRPLSFPGESARPAYRFDLADQHALHRTLGVTAATWLRFTSPLTTWFVALAMRCGLGRLLRVPSIRSLIARALSGVHLGSRRCGVAARATGRTRGDPLTRTCAVMGREEALMTAVVAVEVVRQVLSDDFPPGVLHSHEAIDLGPVLEALEREISELVISLPT